MKGEIKGEKDQSSTSSDAEPQYLFVLSPPFSGSTILHNLLATSPSVSTLPAEGQHLREAAEHMRGEHWSPNLEVPWEKIKQVWDDAWEGNGPIFLEKSPPNVLRAEEIKKHFQPSSFIIMMRDPYAFTEGIRRRNNNFGVIRGVKLWVRIAKYQKKNIENLNSVIFFNYRIFTGSLGCTVANILEFIPELEVLSPDRVVGWGENRKEPVIRNLNPTQIRRLSNGDINRINHVLREVPDLLKYFNYRYITPSTARTFDSIRARVESSILSAVRFRGWAPKFITKKVEQYLYRDLEAADGA
jgi:hypothetical protein